MVSGTSNTFGNVPTKKPSATEHDKDLRFAYARSFCQNDVSSGNREVQAELGLTNLRPGYLKLSTRGTFEPAVIGLCDARLRISLLY